MIVVNSDLSQLERGSKSLKDKKKPHGPVQPVPQAWVSDGWENSHPCPQCVATVTITRYGSQNG